MDADALFADLYREFFLPFPCFALAHKGGRGFVVEPAADGTAALVVLTDADLLRRYKAPRRGAKLVSVRLNGPADLRAVVMGLPAAVSHVTFDPAPHFHRRYPVGVLSRSLAGAA